MINQLNASQPIVDESGVMTQPMRTFAQQNTDASLLIGTGSPEGAVNANQGRTYMNDAGTTGNILYIKQLSHIGGDQSQGWVLV